MKLLRIRIQGFLGYREAVDIDLASITGACAVVGRNGSGKSSIPQAIGWTITGRLRIANEKDSVVNDFEDHAEVTLDFEDHHGDMYRIHRYRGYRGRTVLQLYVYDLEGAEWNTVGSHRINDVQEHIYDLLEVDENTLYSILLIDQTAEGSRFISSSPTGRLSIIRNQVPDLRIWHRLAWFADRMRAGAVDGLDAAKHKLSDLETRSKDLGVEDDEVVEELSEVPPHDDIVTSIAELETEIEGLRSTIQEAREGHGDIQAELTLMRSQRRARNAEIEASRVRLQGRLDSLIARMAQLDRDRSRVDEIGVELQRIVEPTEQRAEMDVAATSIATYNDELAEAAERLDTATSGESVATAHLDELIQRRDALKVQRRHADGGTCWVCSSHLTHEQVQRQLDAVEKQVGDAEQKASALGAERTAARRAMERIRSLLEDAERRHQKLQREIDRAESSAQHLRRSLGDELSAVRLRIEEGAELDPSEIDRMEDELAALVPVEVSGDERRLAEDIAQLDAEHPLTSVLNERRAQLEASRTLLRKVDRLLGRQDTVRRSLAKVRKDIKDIRRTLPDLTQEVEDRTAVYRACTERGVPGMLLDGTLRLLEEDMNEILRRLGPEDRWMSVELRQQRELKSREGSRDGLLDIVVHTPDGYERMVESLSTGERIRLAMASVFAQLNVLNNRSGTRMVNSLFLDEPFGNLDDDALGVMMQVVREAISSGIVDTVYIITHQQTVIDAAGRRIIVERLPENNHSPSLVVA